VLDRIKANGMRWTGYTAYFTVCFLIGCYLTFPYGRVRDWLQEQAFAASGGAAELQIGELEPSWVTGVELADVRYIRGAGTGGGEPNVVEFDELTVRASALAALVGALTVSFSGEGGGGTVDGVFSKDGDAMSINAEFEGLDVGAVGLTSVAGLPLRGGLTGLVDIEIPEDIKEMSGSVDLAVEGLMLGDGKAKLKVPGMRQGFTLERIEAGKLDIEATVADGVLELKKVRAQGKDLSLDASGSVRLASKFSRSRMDLTVEAGFSDAYKNRDDKTKALFELMNFQRKVKQAMTPEGALRYRIGGTVSVPRATPSGKNRGSKASAKRKARTKKRKKPKINTKGKTQDKGEP